MDGRVTFYDNSLQNFLRQIDFNVIIYAWHWHALAPRIFFGTLNRQCHGSGYYLKEHNRFGLDDTHYACGTSEFDILFNAADKDNAMMPRPKAMIFL